MTGGMMPALVIRGVEHDRRLIAAYQQAIVFYERHRSYPAGEVHGLLTALRIRAERFDKHPQYEDAWRPD